ncbi:hypothetical protein [Paenibacillus taiwanensis]|uniref:hypothetical protein n=1 Tax=Paenibacillus taiwanensis TaxID=401638 RepID=UPI00048A81C1|nr:hypothetical protein [Paenibacillus taiwanensis]
MTDNLLSWGGLIVGLFGLLLAIYQFNEKKKLEKFICAENWFNYERSNTTSGTLQKAITLYKERHNDNRDFDVFESLTQADIFCQETYMSCIRQIQISEPNFTEKSIKKWTEEGKITEEKAKLFKKFIVENDKR